MEDALHRAGDGAAAGAVAALVRLRRDGVGRIVLRATFAIASLIEGAEPTLAER